ncbi:MAG: LysR family transcriptional regulator [Sporolactobacillus sp.]
MVGRAVTFDQLRYFIAVCQQKNVSRAAALLAVSQSSLSKQLRLLADELGLQLINTRNRRQLKVTDAGRSFYLYAQTIIHQYEKMRRDMQAYRNVEKGTLLIGSIPIMSQYGITDRLAQFINDYPQIDVHLIEREGEQIMKQLLSGELDMAIVRDMQAPAQAVDTELLAVDELQVVLPKRHWLAGHSIVRMADLEREAFILLAPGSGIYECVIELCRTAGYTPAVRLTHTRIETIVDMIDKTGGVSLMPVRSIKPFVGANVTLKPLVEKTTNRLLLAVAKRRELNPALARLKSYLSNDNMNGS